MSKPASYTELVTAVQDYLHRTDLTSTYVDYMITEAEAEMNARLRVRRQLTASTPTVSSTGVVTLPSDFGGWKRFTASDGSVKWDLDILQAESERDISNAATATGKPRAIISVGSTHVLRPYEDGTYTYTALYYGRIPNLTSGAATNWVILNFPMAYLYGCLSAARGYVQDDSRFPVWQAQFSRAIEQIIDEDALDKDSRTNAILTPNTAMFGRTLRNNIETDE